MSYLSENTNTSKSRLVSSNGSINNNNNTPSDAVAIQAIPVSKVLPRQGQVMMFNGLEYETNDLDGGYF